MGLVCHTGTKRAFDFQKVDLFRIFLKIRTAPKRFLRATALARGKPPPLARGKASALARRVFREHPHLPGADFHEKRSRNA
jgi:hypothetical protein